MANASKIIKSKERVRDFAEVFTAEREVRSMLDLVKYLSENTENTFLEPSCGNGNFLVTILLRKLEKIKQDYKDRANKIINNRTDVEFYISKAVAAIYGIDISEENIKEAKQRMFNEVQGFCSNALGARKSNEGFWDSVNWVLEKNIIVGDMLNKINDVVLIEYTTPKRYYFKRQELRLSDQLSKGKQSDTLFDIQAPLKNYKITHYLRLCF